MCNGELMMMCVTGKRLGGDLGKCQEENLHIVSKSNFAK